MSAPRRVCVFAGSTPGARPAYAEAAAAVGRGLAERGIGMVFGGGRAGLMGAAADAALAAGGEVIGVIPEALVRREVAHRALTELHVVATMHARKALMAELSDAFLVLPGGLGTLEEIAEVTTWSQLGLHDKPGVLLEVAGFWAGLDALLDHMVTEGFVVPANRGLLRSADSLAAALALMG